MVDTATFIRKNKDLAQLRELTEKGIFEKSKFVITKYIELNDDDFEFFCEDFYKHQEFIIENLTNMGFENDTFLCLLVYNKNSNDGILVESEGYSYARYTALINMSEVAK